MSEILHTCILILHVLGASLIIGSSFVSAYVLTSEKVPWPNITFIARLWKSMGVVLGIQLVTGLYLSGSEWNEVGKNPFFWIKIVLFLTVGVLNSFTLARSMKLALSKETKEVFMPGVSRWAWVSLIAMATLAALGVLIAEMHT